MTPEQKDQLALMILHRPSRERIPRRSTQFVVLFTVRNLCVMSKSREFIPLDWIVRETLIKKEQVIEDLVALEGLGLLQCKVQEDKGFSWRVSDEFKETLVRAKETMSINLTVTELVDFKM